MSTTFPWELGAYARTDDPLTSHKAVTKTNALRWGTQCYRLLAEYVRLGPLTDEEAAVAAGLTATAVISKQTHICRDGDPSRVPVHISAATTRAPARFLP